MKNFKVYVRINYTITNIFVTASDAIRAGEIAESRTNGKAVNTVEMK
jgi:hypothetical protein